MEAKSSPFESSEMLATSLMSTPFFANSAAPRSFVADQRGEVGYLVFSGVQLIDGSEPSCGTLLALGERRCKRLFLLLRCDGDGEGTVTADFQNQEFQANVKVIVLTGHSFGATIASLTALWLPSQSPVPLIILEIPRAEDVAVNIPTETSGGVENQTNEILEDIQSPSTVMAGQGNIQSPMPAIIQEIPRAEDVVVNIPTETSGGVQNQTDEIWEDIQSPSTAIASQGNIQSPMPELLQEIRRAGDVEANIPIETEESSREHKKKKGVKGKKEMLMLSLMATSLASASTGFFAVNQHANLDWLGMVFMICLGLVVVLAIVGKRYQSRRMMRWGSHFTRATMVLMVVMVIAAAMLRKRGGTNGVQNNQELARRLLKNLELFQEVRKGARYEGVVRRCSG